MTFKTHLLLTACAGALSLGVLVTAPPTYAQNTMGKDEKDMMKSDKKDMTPSGTMTKNDKKDMMKKDETMKKDDMKK